MTMIDLVFPVVGFQIPCDHAYPLYAALCKMAPALHEPDLPIGMVPVNGQYVGEGRLRLDPSISRLRLRLPAEAIPRVLPLAGKSIQLMGHRLQLGAPQVHALTPAAALFAKVVTIKHATTEDALMESARQQLARDGIAGTVEIPRALFGQRGGELRRMVLRIKESTIIGFPLIVRNLSADDSVKLQSKGLGGRRRMGGGIFVPAKGEE